MTAGIDILKDTDAFLLYPIVCSAYFEKNGVTVLDVQNRSRQKVEIGMYRLAGRRTGPEEAWVLDELRDKTAAMEQHGLGQR